MNLKVSIDKVMLKKARDFAGVDDGQQKRAKNRAKIVLFIAGLVWGAPSKGTCPGTDG